MLKKNICIVLIVCMLLPLLIMDVSASADNVITYPVDGGNIYFDTNTGKIIDSDRNITRVILPIEIDGIPVKFIGEKAFDWCCCLESVVIPSSVEGIGEMAFIHCNQLVDLIIADGVTRIENSAFEYCTSLMSVSIPRSVEYIGERAFADCRNLTGVSIAGDDTVIGDYAFTDCYSLDTVVLSSPISFDFAKVFKFCWSLKGVLFASEQPIAQFDDVSETDWFFNAVNFAVSNGLFNGVSERLFSPNTPMTRAMLVTVLWRYAGNPATSGSTFSDVDDGSWYSEAVGWAQYHGIVNGVGSNNFNPDGRLTREQLATILMRYDYLNNENCSVDSGNAMSWAVCNRLIQGNVINGVYSLDPNGNATRAQVAEVLMRYISHEH